MISPMISYAPPQIPGINVLGVGADLGGKVVAPADAGAGAGGALPVDWAMAGSLISLGWRPFRFAKVFLR